MYKTIDDMTELILVNKSGKEILRIQKSKEELTKTSTKGEEQND